MVLNDGAGCFLFLSQIGQHRGAGGALPFELRQPLRIATVSLLVADLAAGSGHLVNLCVDPRDIALQVLRRLQMLPLHQRHFSRVPVQSAAGLPALRRQRLLIFLFVQRRDAQHDSDGPEEADVSGNMRRLAVEIPLAVVRFRGWVFSCVALGVGPQKGVVALRDLVVPLVFQQSLPHGFFFIGGAKPECAGTLLGAEGPDRGVLVVWAALELIAQLAEHRGHLRPAAAQGQRLVQCLAHQIEAGGLSVPLGKVDGARRLVPLRVLYHRQAALLADAVRHGAQGIVDAVLGFQLAPIPHSHGVHDKVVVVGSRVEVGRHQHLIAVAPEPPGGLQPDPVTFRRRHLAGLEGLVCVVGYIAAGLAEAPLGSGHLLCRRFCAAVDAGDGVALLALVQGFGLVGGVDEHLLQIRQPGLLRVAAVVHHAGNAVMDRPNLRHRHWHRPPLRDRPAKAGLQFPSARR